MHSSNPRENGSLRGTNPYGKDSNSGGTNAGGSKLKPSITEMIRN
jgi:hypothetical protein